MGSSCVGRGVQPMPLALIHSAGERGLPGCPVRAKGEVAAGALQAHAPQAIKSSWRAVKAGTAATAPLLPIPAAGDAAPRAVAEAAVAAAEASGALPPLAGAQRAAVVAFFGRLAEELGENGGQDAGFEPFGERAAGQGTAQGAKASQQGRARGRGSPHLGPVTRPEGLPHPPPPPPQPRSPTHPEVQAPAAARRATAWRTPR